MIKLPTYPKRTYMKHSPSQIQTWFRSNVAVVIVVVGSLAAVNFAFGAKKDPTDVTAKVAAAVKDESLSITAGNDFFGDTAPGIPKKLTVEYSVGEDTFTREMGENGRMKIAAPAGKRLAILKAN